MAKAMSKEAQIAALRETNGQLEADVVALSNAVGDLEAEIVTERAVAIEKVKEAQAKTLDALSKTAGQAADDLKVQIEWLKGALEAAKEKAAKLTEERDWAEKGREQAERDMEAVGADYRARIEKLEAEDDNLREAHKEEIEALTEKLEKENREAIDEAEKAAADDAENLRAALDGYLADLGYPRDPHPSTITCPNLRRLVTEIN
jgi:chromosome segregation ATPase